MNEIPFYTAANLTRDPELRSTADGKSVARLSLAVTPRRREKAAWVDGTTSFVDATVWGEQAENVATSLHKGDRVIVTGRLETRVYTATKGANAGQEVRKLEIVVDEIGPSLRWAEAQIQRTSPQPSKEASVSEGAPVPQVSTGSVVRRIGTYHCAKDVREEILVRRIRGPRFREDGEA